MQYLLTEEEMTAIRAERDALRRIPCNGDLIEGLKNVCQMVATTMIATGRTPFQHPYADGSATENRKPYGCIHVNRAESYGYCDRCPVQGICPQPKEYSK